jgi:Tol biopolymer transport system component
MGVSPATTITMETGGDIYTLHVDGTNRLRRTNYQYNDHPVMSPDHQWIAYRSLPLSLVGKPNPDGSDDAFRSCSYTKNIWIMDAQTSKAIKLTNSELGRSVPVWSADSRKVGFIEIAENKQAFVEIDIATQIRREIAQSVRLARYHPGGNGIAYINFQGDLVWLDKTGASQVIVQGKPQLQVHSFDWMPDGQALVYALSDSSNSDSENGAIGPVYSTWIIEGNNGSPRKLADKFSDVSVSPDGKFVAGYVGSGGGDAGFIFLSLAFFRIDSDGTAGPVIDFGDFTVPSVIKDTVSNPQFAEFDWVGGHLGVARYGELWGGDRGGLTALVDLDHKQFIPIWQPAYAGQPH